MITAYLDAMQQALRQLPDDWRQSALALSRERLLEKPHGDLPRWLTAAEALPNIPAQIHGDGAVVTLEALESTPVEGAVREALMGLHPWRKGPFRVFGQDIDTEWRSDWKWQRVEPHIDDLEGRTVLDVGCGSGYHLWRMWAAGAKLAVGIDPGMLFLCQFLALKQYQPALPLWFVPARLEELPATTGAFDTVFSMGVLYHRRSPLDHLQELIGTLRPGGQLVLETLVVEGDETTVLVPGERYAQMRNVFFLPSSRALSGWLARCGYEKVQVVDEAMTTTDEQRSTEWMRFHSLAEFLDPDDPSRTVEGYPAPRRAVILANRPGG